MCCNDHSEKHTEVNRARLMPFGATGNHTAPQLTFVTPICSFRNFSKGLMSRSDAFCTWTGKNRERLLLQCSSNTAA